MGLLRVLQRGSLHPTWDPVASWAAALNLQAACPGTARSCALLCRLPHCPKYTPGHMSSPSTSIQSRNRWPLRAQLGEVSWQVRAAEGPSQGAKHTEPALSWSPLAPTSPVPATTAWTLTAPHHLPQGLVGPRTPAGAETRDEAAGSPARAFRGGSPLPAPIPGAMSSAPLPNGGAPAGPGVGKHTPSALSSAPLDRPGGKAICGHRPPGQERRGGGSQSGSPSGKSMCMQGGARTGLEGFKNGT